ncbi:MAG TPA: pentapeptide repeat-containing protein [Elusimicrobiota bacterium]|nr:pentapeptide repeat-containing protein [Elusimicrobiota bacterium]
MMGSPQSDYSAQSLPRTNFSSTSLHATQFINADLTEADFSSSRLTGVDFNLATLTRAVFTRATLVDCRLSDRPIVGADFRSADLRGGDFRFVEFREVRFDGADLTGAVLSGCSFVRCGFSQARLSSADCSGSYFAETDLDQADLTRAKFNHALFRKTPLNTPHLLESEFWGARGIPSDQKSAIRQAGGSVGSTIRRWERLLELRGFSKRAQRIVGVGVLLLLFSGVWVRLENPYYWSDHELVSAIRAAQGENDASRLEKMKGVLSDRYSARIQSPHGLSNRYLQLVRKIITDYRSLGYEKEAISLVDDQLGRYSIDDSRLGLEGKIILIDIHRLAGRTEQAFRWALRVLEQYESPVREIQVLKNIIAQLCLEQGMTADAERYLTEILSSPSAIDLDRTRQAEIALMEVYRRRGQYEKAFGVGRRFLQEAGGSTELSSHANYQLGQIAMEAGRASEASGYFHESLRRGRRQKWGWLLQARLRLIELERKKDSPGDALKSLTGLLDDPSLGNQDRMRIYSLMGQIQSEAGNLPEAMKYYQWIVDQNRDSRSADLFEAKMKLINIQVRQLKLKEALSSCQRLREEQSSQGPRMLRIDLQTGDIHSRLKREEEALRCYERASAPLPEAEPWIRYTAQMNILQIHRKRGEQARAMSVAEDMLRENQGFPERLPKIHLYIGQLHADRKQWAAAERAYQDVIDRFPSDQGIVFAARLGQLELLEARKRFPEAFDRYRELLDIYSRDDGKLLRIHKQMARLYIKTEEWADAARHFETILEKYVNEDTFQRYDAHKYLIEIYIRMNDRSRAQRHGDAILNEFADVPGFVAQAHFYLGELAVMDKEWDTAADHFHRALDGLSDDPERLSRLRKYLADIDRLKGKTVSPGGPGGAGR